MAVTITGNDGVVFTFNDEEVDSINVSESSSPDQYGQYGGGPADAYVYESDGPVARIVMRGVLIAASTTRTSSGTTTSLLQQRQWLSKLQNGQQTPKAFSSNYAGTMYSGISETFVPTTVYAASFDWSEEGSQFGVIPFTLTLLVGGQ